MRENCAGRQDLDVIGAAMREFAHLLPHLPGTVRLAVAKIPGQLDIRASPVIAPAPSLMVTYAPATYMRGPDEYALGDGIAHGHIVEGAIDADVAHRREAGQQGDGRIRDGGISGFNCGQAQKSSGSDVGKIGQMSVAVDQPRQHCHLRHIDDVGTFRHRQIRHRPPRSSCLG